MCFRQFGKILGKKGGLMCSAIKLLTLAAWGLFLLITGGVSGFPVADEQSPGGISVVSLNVASAKDGSSLSRELQERNLDKADIYLLQEVIGEDEENSAVANGLLPDRNLHIYYRGAFEIDPGKMYGLAIVSRFPLRDLNVIMLKRNDLNVRSRTRIALAATAETPIGPITVINTHLDTRISLKQRLEQLEPVVDYAAGAGLPAVLGGDLNTNPHRWLFHLVPIPYAQPQKDALRKYMNDWGFESAIDGAAVTHDALKMQLDWVFLRGLYAAETRVQPLKHSDHHAIFCRIITSAIAAGAHGSQPDQ